MRVLAPILSGKENAPEYIEAVTSKATKIILLLVIDKEFMKKTSAAMSEVMQFHSLMAEVKKAIGSKKKSCEEVTEWGSTTQKIASLALLQEINKVVLVKQNNKFFDEVVSGLKKKKIKVELVNVKEQVA